jgi:2-amino-4-hydroxy-6-hydroxymethyldihydropteridine diphosphokinase
MKRCLIALGGNLGQVEMAFRAARAALAALPESRVIASSLLYRTPPIGPPGQPDYLNAVLLLETPLPPGELLQTLHAIEARHGRVRQERWGARTLDLDLLACEELCSDVPELMLPHPELARRMFVLRPLCDVAPEWHHPRLGKTARQLMDALLASGESPLPEGVPW